MSIDKKNENSEIKKTETVFLFDKYICDYISKEWFSNGESNSSLGKKFGVDRRIIGKIKEEDGYRIPMSSLAIIVFNKNIQLSDFFKLIEERYGNLKDIFVDKNRSMISKKDEKKW